MSRAHVITEMDSLCPDMHLRQPWRLSNNLRDECDDLVSEHSEAIVAAFRAVYKGGHGLMLPAREVCVGQKICKAREFDGFLPQLQNWHFNYTQVSKVDAKEFAASGAIPSEFDKYDENKDGVLDTDELAKRSADKASTDGEDPTANREL